MYIQVYTYYAYFSIDSLEFFPVSTKKTQHPLEKLLFPPLPRVSCLRGSSNPKRRPRRKEKRGTRIPSGVIYPGPPIMRPILQGGNRSRRNFLMESGQITLIPIPELRGFWGSSPIKPPLRVTSADVVIICPESWDPSYPSSFPPFRCLFVE